MHNAPSVSYPVGRSAFFLCLLALASVSGLVSVVLGVCVGDASVALLTFVAWLVWLVIAAGAWRRLPRGTLSWRMSVVSLEAAPLSSEGAWFWSSEAYQEGVALQKVERVYDFQNALLIRLYNPDGARSWIWVERRADTVRWDDVRRALWAHA